jgi:hypothetical protein
MTMRFINCGLITRKLKVTRRNSQNDDFIPLEVNKYQVILQGHDVPRNRFECPKRAAFVERAAKHNKDSWREFVS